MRNLRRKLDTRKSGFGRRRCTVGVIVVGVAAVLALPAAATPPGTNGMITWQREALNGPPHLMVASADGSGARSVFASRGSAEFEGTFSPVSPNLYFFTRGGRAPYSEDIYSGDLASGRTRKVIRARSADIAPSVSPDGARIVYFSAPRPAVLREDRPGPPERIRVANIDGTGGFAITPKNRRSFDPDWSPDGTQIVYTEGRLTRRPQLRIAIINADGTGRRALTAFAGADEINPKWTPDGRTIVFERAAQTGTKSDILALDVASGAVRPVLVTPAFETNPIPSPDGTRILFTSDRDRRGRNRLGPGFEVYTMALDGSAVVRLTNNRRPDIFPDWQRLP